MLRVVIVGNGIAGVTAARNIRKRDKTSIITVVSSESQYFFSRPSMMYIYMGHLEFEHTKPYEDWFWQKNSIDLVQDFAVKIDATEKKLHLQSGNILRFDALIIATGSKSNKFGWRGQDLAGVQGLYSLQDLQLMEGSTRGIESAVVVGGGLIGIEVAEMLHSRRVHVSMIVREKSYWSNILPLEESMLIGRHIIEQGIDLLFSDELEEIVGDESGKVTSVRTKDGKSIPAQFVALTAGVSPNTDLAVSSGIAIGRGVLVNDFFETALPDVYAIGDCAEVVPIDGSKSYVQPLWYTGKLHGECVAKTITGKRTEYEKGVFFNSAKFFDIEYQTYGEVAPDITETPDLHTLFWEHPNGKSSIRINYSSESVIGFNVMGIRYRHRICEQWLREKRPIQFVLEHLQEANFDPEFSKRFESEVVEQFNNSSGSRLIPIPSRGILGFKRFLSSVP